MDNSHNDILRKKFVSVLAPVIASGDENNISSLLSTLVNVCRPDSGLLISTSDNLIEQTKACEFSCWLISELVTLECSPKVHEASVNIQVIIFQLNASRNFKLFPVLLKDFIKFVKDGTDILFDGGTKIHNFFETAVNYENANLKPKIFTIQDKNSLDNILATAIEVLGHLGSYILLYSGGFLNEVWHLFGLCLEAGSLNLKCSSLESMTKLIDVSGFPNGLEVLDYIIQLVGGCTLSIGRGDFNGIKDENVTRFEEKLLEIIRRLRKNLNSINPIFINEIGRSLEQFLQYHHRFLNLKETLLKELLHLTCDLVKIRTKNVPEDSILAAMEEAMMPSMRLAQVIDTCLKFLIINELDKVIPSDNTSSSPKKRTHDQSENESAGLDCWSLSLWWSKVLDEIKTIIEENDDKDLCDDTKLNKNLETLHNYLNLLLEIIAHYSHQSLISSLSYIPCSLIQSLSDHLLSLLSVTKNNEQVLKLYSILKYLAFLTIASKELEGEETKELLHNWVGVGSIPWLAGQMNWFDLKPSKKNTLLAISSKATWTNDADVKLSCIPILSVVPNIAAPNWRCFIIRAVLNENEDNVTANVALWLPLLIHQLPSSSSQSILAESVGKFISTEETFVRLNVGVSLRSLFCVLSNQAIIRPKNNYSNSSELLYCSECENAVEKVCFSSVNPKSQVDSALVQRFLTLLDEGDKEIVFEFLNALSAIAVHCSLSSNSFLSLMNLMVHHDEDVCEAFADKMTVILNVERTRFVNGDCEKRQFAQATISFLQDLMNCNEANNVKHLRNQRNTMHVLSHLTKKEDSCFEEDILKFIVHFIASSDREVSSLACLFVSDWCETLTITPKELYLRNRKSLAQVITEVCKEGEISFMMNQIGDVFAWSHGKEQRDGWVSFGISQLRHLLPPLVLKSSNEDKPSLLVELSRCFGLKLRDMLIDPFQHILAHLVFHSTEEEKHQVLSYISTTTNIEIANIRKCSVQDCGVGLQLENIRLLIFLAILLLNFLSDPDSLDILTLKNQVNELIFGLHAHKEAVLKEFLEIKAIESGQKNVTGRLKQDGVNKLKLIGDFLSPRLLGILGFLDGKLLSSQTMQSDKECALLSLSELLSVMGKPHVSPVARKVLASLKTALKIETENFLSINTQAWISFLSRLDDSTLESIIEEVVVLCLPLLRVNPELLAPVFKMILVDTPSIQPLLQYLPLLPQHQSLASINEVISKSQKRLHGESKECVIENLESVKKNLTHESQDVRLFGLKKLKIILRKNQTFIHQLILNSDKAHRTVSDIFTSLLEQCREHEELDLLVAECLGLFGAIDPARLHVDAKKNKLSEIYESIETEQFIADLVTELARAYLSASDANTQTCASYALQEIIRIYKIGASTSRSTTSVGHIVYNKLPSNILEILEPLHTSKYTVTSWSQRSPAVFPSPVYRSKYSKTFNLWVTTWTCSLIDLLVGEATKQVYSSCKPLVRRDISTALHILPQLIICVLTENKDNQVPVSTEFLTVIGVEVSKDTKAKFQPTAEVQHLAVQTIFSGLDYVQRWSQERRQNETSYRKNKVVFSPSLQLQNVMDFLDQIPADALASASFKSQAYSRALLHLEAHCEKYPEQLKTNLSFLQSIYVELDEPDGVAGVAAIRQDEPSLKEQIIQYEATGRLHDALGCYERLCIAQETEESYKGMLKCYLNLGQPQSVLNITQGLISRKNDFGNHLHEYRVEAAWRLGQWGELETLLNSSTLSQGLSWGEGVGKALLAARERNSDSYQKAMRDLRIRQITPLSAASMEKSAYQRAYPYILRLQILNEMDEMLLGLLKIPCTSLTDQQKHEKQKIEFGTPLDSAPSLSLNELEERWSQRFSLLQMSHRFMEPLLNFRRTLLELGRDWTIETNPEQNESLREELERSWLKSAKVARKAGHLQQGELAFYGAGQGRDVFVERAKWHWAKGEQPQAVSVLKRGIDKFFPNIEVLKTDVSSGSISNERISCSRAKLLLARYSEESATLDVSTVKDFYRDVCEINKCWEDGHFNLAMYYDRILNSLDMKVKPVEWLSHIVQSFGKSLNYGCRHIYQSMPRLLSIWLDLGAKVAEMESSHSSASTMKVYIEKLNIMNNFLTQMLQRLPSYMFLIALPQLISRICHSNKGVINVLSQIIAAMLNKHPQQSIWHLVAVSKSSYQTRRERCIQVFNIAKKADRSLDKFIADATKLADLLIDLADKFVEKGVSTVKLDSFMRALPRLLSDPKFSSIILPLQNQMNVTLPTLSVNLKNLHDHNPFQRKEIYFSGIEDEIEIMQSLVKPKKITVRGSDGKQYIMMCKPKDDMRKDCRLMEFNSLINMLLMKDPETRKRDLKIRTYMVIPLNEECGLIEWVPNLNGFRNILYKLYKEMGMYTSGQELKNLMLNVNDPLKLKRDAFLNKLLPKYPSVFSKWFLLTFVDPQSWVMARWAYCRTTAVMSMIGYIVGLGDRHGENILFDSESGETVHVDLNCIFNKGETFDWPERVPFRLTHNMVSAMGPTGVEGIFRKTCEVTMRVMREKREELMSVLKPFVYDPLVEWEKAERRTAGLNKGQKDKGKDIGEICNAKAQVLVKNIEERLSGQIRSDSRGVNLPLSVEGQVNVLIKDATSIDNLCQMYIGWTPFM